MRIKILFFFIFESNQNLTDWFFSLDGAGWILGIISLLILIAVVINKRKKSTPTDKLLQIEPVNVNRGIENRVHTPFKNSPIEPQKIKIKTVTENKNISSQSGTITLKGYDTFLSYNRDDELDVKRIYEYLTDTGLKVWFDLESIKPGDDWLEAMQEGLKNSKSCLVFYRNESGVWKNEETKAAMRKRADNPVFKIIPVLLPGAQDSDSSLPDFLKGINWVDLQDGLFNVPVLKKLVDAIRGGELVPIYPVSDEQQITEELPAGYKADVRKIISLLIGEALYSRRDVAIRELIQNAVDACERRGNSLFGATAKAEVIVQINTKEGYFEIIDNGDGMNSKFLSEYFAVIGKSIKDEENIMERMQEDEKTRTYIIGRFGIGFISIYMLAKSVEISTTYEGAEQINLEIKGISETFVYYNASKVGRAAEEIGTTVRVYLKDALLSQTDSYLDIPQAVKEFCRHTQYVKLVKDRELIPLKDSWNIGGAEILDVTKVPFKFELHLGISDKNIDFYASNAGFLINRISDAITPELMPINIGGEISFFPGTIDLNMARDTIISNEKSIQIKGLVSKAIKNLLIKASSHRDMLSEKVLKSILGAYLLEALKFEEKIKADGSSSTTTETQSPTFVTDAEAPPLSSIEAAELLMDVWVVSLLDEKYTLREALNKVKQAGKYRVYNKSSTYSKSVDYFIQETLINRGFLFVELYSEDIQFKSGKSVEVYSYKVLKYLSERYFFDVYHPYNPYQEDVEDLNLPKDILTPRLENILNEIELSTGQQVYLNGLKGAPVVFDLAGKKYLNVKSDVFIKAEKSFKNYDELSLKSYILGLLQYQIE